MAMDAQMMLILKLCAKTRELRLDSFEAPYGHFLGHVATSFMRRHPRQQGGSELHWVR